MWNILVCLNWALDLEVCPDKHIVLGPQIMACSKKRLLTCKGKNKNVIR